MSSFIDRILETYDAHYKHPVLSVPLSNEGKHSKPSVYDYNRVVKREGLYQADRVLEVKSCSFLQTLSGDLSTLCWT